MPSFTVKNIPDDLYRLIKTAAEEHRRSVNSEIIVCLERALGADRIDPHGTAEAARRLRESMSGPPLSLAEIQEAKEVGRQ